MSIPKYPLSLEEAKQAPDGYVLIEGDYGGLCFLVCPANLVKCDERTLRLLAADLEETIFPSNTEGADVRYARLSPNERIADHALGEEDGIALSTLWLPKWLSEAGLDGKIRNVVAGVLEGLNLSISEQSMVKVLHDDYFTEKFAELTK